MTPPGCKVCMWRDGFESSVHVIPGPISPLDQAFLCSPNWLKHVNIYVQTEWYCRPRWGTGCTSNFHKIIIPFLSQKNRGLFSNRKTMKNWNVNSGWCFPLFSPFCSLSPCLGTLRSKKHPWQPGIQSASRQQLLVARERMQGHLLHTNWKGMTTKSCQLTCVCRQYQGSRHVDTCRG